MYIRIIPGKYRGHDRVRLLTYNSSCGLLCSNGCGPGSAAEAGIGSKESFYKILSLIHI